MGQTDDELAALPVRQEFRRSLVVGLDPGEPRLRGVGYADADAKPRPKPLTVDRAAHGRDGVAEEDQLLPLHRERKLDGMGHR